MFCECCALLATAAITLNIALLKHFRLFKNLFYCRVYFPLWNKINFFSNFDNKAGGFNNLVCLSSFFYINFKNSVRIEPIMTKFMLNCMRKEVYQIFLKNSFKILLRAIRNVKISYNIFIVSYTLGII